MVARSELVSVKSDRPSRPDSCSWRKMTSRSGPLNARQAVIGRSGARRTRGLRSGWRGRSSSSTPPPPRRGLQDRLDLGVPGAPGEQAAGGPLGSRFCEGCRGSASIR